MSQRPAVLEVEQLSISYRVNKRWIKALRDFNLKVAAGQIYGVVGESGSGKTTAVRGIMHYLPPNGRIEEGAKVSFLGEDITRKSRQQMQRIWGRRMSFVPQNPAKALNPSLRLGEQIAEVVEHHLGLGPRQARQKVIEALRRVSLADPERLLARYPHEISGGQQQRVLIAMALVTSPKLIILDEPTSSLDVTTEAVILGLIRDLLAAEDTGALYVTHNLGVVAQLCDRVTVMYAGEVMEDAPVGALYSRPLNPYTIGLLTSIPRPGQTKRDRPLHTIAGRPPSLVDRPEGCVFATRCPLAADVCHTRPPLEFLGEGRLTRCHRWREIAAGEVDVGDLYQTDREALDTESLEEGREPLLVVKGLTKRFASAPSPGEILRGERPAPVCAVNGVSLTIRRGRTYGLVGESGSGKTTLARMIMGLTEKTQGDVILGGTRLKPKVAQRCREMLAQLQMVFQDPQNTLNPYMPVGEAIQRPLVTLGGRSRSEAESAAQRLLEAVNLRAEYAARYPSELSGGEKQRVALARAFASNPALIICDEPVSALDVSVQAAVLNLLSRLQAERETSYLFISHDLAVVGYLSDYVAVMYLGEFYEVGPARDLFKAPMHPYTEALVSAIPVPDPRHRTHPVHLRGEMPSPSEVPKGCRFHTRCPYKIGETCEQESPPWQEVSEHHYIRCHHSIQYLREAQEEGSGRGGN